MLANTGVKEHAAKSPQPTGLVPGVDWPKAIRALRESLKLSWGGLARRLGVHYDQVSRLRNGKRRAGFIMAGRIIGLAIEEDVLAEVFEGTARKESPRSRFKVPLPLPSRSRRVFTDDISAVQEDEDPSA